MIAPQHQITSKRRQEYLLHNAYGDADVMGKRTAIYNPDTRTTKQQRTGGDYGFFPLPPSQSQPVSFLPDVGTTRKRSRSVTTTDTSSNPNLQGEFVFAPSSSILNDMPKVNVDMEFPTPPSLPSPPTEERAIQDVDVPVQATTSEPAVPVQAPSANDMNYLEDVEKREMSTQTTPSRKPRLQKFNFDVVEHKQETIVENPRRRPPPIIVPKPQEAESGEAPRRKKKQEPLPSMQLSAPYTPSIAMGSPNDSMDDRPNTNSVYEEKWAYSPHTPQSQLSSRSGRAGEEPETPYSQLSYRGQIRQILSKNRADAMQTSTPRTVAGVDFTAPREKMEVDPIDVTVPPRNAPAPPAYHTIGGPPQGPLMMTAFRPSGRRGRGGGGSMVQPKKKKTKKVAKKKKKK